MPPIACSSPRFAATQYEHPYASARRWRSGLDYARYRRACRPLHRPAEIVGYDVIASLGLNGDDVFGDRRDDSVCHDLTFGRSTLIGADLLPDSAVGGAAGIAEHHRAPALFGEVTAMTLNVGSEINRLFAVGEYGSARRAARAVARCAVLLVPDATIVAARRPMLLLSTCRVRNDATND